MTTTPEPSTTVVRRWSDVDRPAVALLDAELQEYERALRPSRRRGADVSEARIAGVETRLRDPDERGELFVALHGEKVVGFISCFVSSDDLEDDPDEVVIEDFIVTRDYRGSGVGRALMEAAERFALGQGIQRLVIATLIENETAVDVYAAFGFRKALVTMEKSRS